MRILVGMSGGVDSSVAAALLKQQGHIVTGVTMEIWDGDAATQEGKHHGCYGAGEAGDVADARRVAACLGIPMHVVDLRHQYRTEVLEHFSREYASGRTPNPCVRCNRRIKFGALVNSALQGGIEFDRFATGHYARVDYNSHLQRYLLKKGKDTGKDQSYFLFMLSQEQLGRTLFPLGDCTKAEVRQLAAVHGLPVADKPESQNFADDGHASLLRDEARPGPILDEQGQVLGRHSGIPFYTVGQRRGLRLASDRPLYVTAIDAGRNAVIVSDRDALYRRELVAGDLNWIAIPKLEQPLSLKAKVRYRHREAEALVSPAGRDRCLVRFTEPQMAPAPGQAVVFYDGDTVVGGGTIEQTG